MSVPRNWPADRDWRVYVDYRDSDYRRYLRHTSGLSDLDALLDAEDTRRARRDWWLEVAAYSLTCLATVVVALYPLGLLLGWWTA